MLRGAKGGQVKHLAAREPHGRALPVLMSMRFAYLAVLPMSGWLALLAGPIAPRTLRS